MTPEVKINDMSTKDCPNLPEPLQLPITYHQVSADAVALAWGVKIGLGNPVQSFSLWPSLFFDFTFVANAQDCGPPPSAGCQGLVGGTYDKNLSTTEVTTIGTPWQNRWNGSLDWGDPATYILYNDVLTLGSNGMTVPGYPFATDDDSKWGKSHLPMLSCKPV